MRILYLTSGFPYPLTSGRLRHYFLIRELAARHEITLLSLVDRNHRPDDESALGPYTERVLTVPVSRARSLPGRIARTTARLAGRADEAVRRVARLAADLTADGSVDIAYFSGRRTAPAAGALGEVPLIVDLCDAASVQLAGAMRVGGPSRLPILAARYVAARRVERGLIRRASHVLFASPRDREATLGSWSHVPAAIVPNGVDLEYWQRRTARLGRDVVFSGAMDYQPNADAARQLIDVVMPFVWREVPDARVAIVGRDPGPDLVARGRRSRVVVTGYVEDLRPYLEGAAVFAAPLRFASGIQNKLLEAMAMGVPVVTTPVAADGLRGDDGRAAPMSVARRPAELAARIVERLRATAADPTPEDAARRFVEERFSWAASGRALDAILGAVNDDRRSHRRC